MAYTDRAYQFRVQLMSCVLALALATIVLRLVWISIQPIEVGTNLAPESPRACIKDRNGHVLASSLLTFSIYAHPCKIQDKVRAIQAIKDLFPKTPKSLLDKICQGQSSFVWIARHVTPQMQMKVSSLGIEGIGAQKDHKRIYPSRNLFCHILGMTDLDQNGISGLEKSCQDQLKLKRQDVITSLDIRIQHCLHQVLTDQIQTFQAKAGNGMVINLRTGEILAMVSWPDFVVGQKAPPEAFFNRNVSGVYEFGSIMKVMNAAFFLEQGGSLHRVFDASHPMRVGRFSIKDFRGKNRPMTVEEGFIYSSNIVNAKMALSFGAKAQLDFFRKMGFMDPVKIEIPEMAHSLIPKRWSQDRVITASYGYGFAVTPLHVMSSLAMLVTGHRIPLTLLKRTQRPDYGPRVISAKTSQSVVELLRLAVLDGQAKNAAASNCHVGAKSGTANLRSGRTYIQNNNMTSCVAIFPIEDPRYGVFVSLHQPIPNAKSQFYATAGWIAAPAVSRLVERLAPLLDVLNPNLIPKEAPKQQHQKLLQR